MRPVRFENRDLFRGWLRDYLDAASANRYPLLFHAACGIFALTSIVGRRAAVRRATYTLWPPTSVLLLGPSGVGKSQTLRFATRVLEAHASSRSEFYLARQYTTTAGMTEAWRKHQEELGLQTLEGAFVMDELVGNLRGTTGTEGFTDWVIAVLEHDSVEKTTKKDGRIVVEGVTVGLGFGTTMAYLREGMDIHQFGGGFGWRFLLVCADRQEERLEAVASNEAVLALAERAGEIRRKAPSLMGISPVAEEKLQAYRIKASEQHYQTIDLDGWYNRYESVIARVALALTLSEEEREIGVDQVQRAKIFVDAYVQPPLLGIVEQLAAGADKAALFKVQENLMRAGATGLDQSSMYRMLPTGRRRQEAVNDLKAMTLAHESKTRERWFGTAAWRDHFDRRK